MAKTTRRRRGVTRRDFLAVGGIGLMGLPVAERLAEARRRGAAQCGPCCVLILMNGGPSPWETFDPKPAAPRDVRGPLRAISTAVPGVAFSETMPQLAAKANRLTVIRSLHHNAAPIHETGLQLLQCGSLRTLTSSPASLGARATAELPPAWGGPAYVLLGGGLHATGTAASPGDAGAAVSIPSGPLVVSSAGAVLRGEDAIVGPEAMTDFDAEPREVLDRYGDSEMGRRLLQARQLVEQGVRFITVNSFTKLEGERTWDAHGCPRTAPATVFDYQSWIGPQFDRAVAALLDDLDERGLLSTTLVVCAGEIGRAPFVNSGGGRDHWTSGFSAVLAGGDACGGEVIGATSEHGGEIASDPVPLESLACRMSRFLGLSEPVASGALTPTPAIA